MSIHAQVIRDHQISWYFFLKDHTPHNNGEFKDQVVNAFFKMAEIDREKVFKTLRTVRIHIVDPRPYAVDLHEGLQRHLPKGTTVTHFLKRLDDSTKHLAEVRDRALEHIATSILRDGPAERLKAGYRAWEYASGFRADDDLAFTDLLPQGRQTEPALIPFDLTPFKHKNANLLNDVANFVSASASVFSPVLDEFAEAMEDCFITSPLAGPWLINSTLGRPHAFDKGHSHAVKWIEQQRADVLSQIDRNRHYYPAYLPQPLIELVSTESVPIQAADIAASLARELWRRNNLPHLVKRFEYVTFNGERLSETRAEHYEVVFRGFPASN